MSVGGIGGMLITGKGNMFNGIEIPIKPGKIDIIEP